jgi:hypothetical protein
MRYLISFVLITFLLPVFALASHTVPAGGFSGAPPPSTPTVMKPIPDTLPGGLTDIVIILTRVANWMFTIFLLVAVIFFILAAYKYLTSGGGEKVAEAHKMIIYSAIAIAVALLSKGFEFVIRQLVT